MPAKCIHVCRTAGETEDAEFFRGEMEIRKQRSLILIEVPKEYYREKYDG